MNRAGHYAAYGLRILSEVPLPHFRPMPDGEAEVIVRLGTVPPKLPEPKQSNVHWDAAPDDYLLRVNDEIRLRVVEGREIVVQRPEGADSLAAVYLMGSGFTALLQQRGLLTLHASAVVSEQGAVLFLGRSGAGKSTLAAALAERGLQILADDVTAIRTTSRGEHLAIPGYPNLRLWRDAFERLGLNADNRRLARDGIDKYLLPIRNLPVKPSIVRATYALAARNSKGLEFTRVAPPVALRILRKHTHRRRLVDGFGDREAYFRTLMWFSHAVPLTRVNQPAAAIAPGILAEHIERHLAEG